MEEAVSTSLSTIANTGIIGALFILLLVYVIYTERNRKMNLDGIMKQMTTYNNETNEEYKALTSNYIEFLKLSLNNCRKLLHGLTDKGIDKLV